MSYNKLINPEEQVLAIKISLFVLLWLFLCFFFLISLNWWYLYVLEKNNFNTDIESFKEILKNEDNGNFPLLSESNIFLKSETKALVQRLTRDIVVLQKDKKVERRGFFLDYEWIEKDLITLPFNSIEVQEVGWNEFLFYKFKYNDIIIYFSRDITNIYDFQERLIINSLLLSLLFFLIVYIIWVKLAKVTLKPIRENNEKLKEYNHYVAHELKTPLSVLKSNIELSEVSKDLDVFRSSKEEISSMESIINGLLFLSETSTFSPNKKISLIEFLELFVEKNKLQKKVLIETREDTTEVMSHPFLLERLFTNLVENAVKYWVDWWIIHIKVFKKMICVENDIKKELKLNNVQKLFEPFFQGDSVGNKNKWHWLWLAIVKRIADICGWDIRIETKNKKFKVIISL